MTRSPKAGASQGQLRIIGGRWRGRKFTFTATEGLRPTGDRIRETLFNWLVGHVQGARCVDLFTGSGALGLEALSRGAAHCDFVDTCKPTLSGVANLLDTLAAGTQGQCHLQTALQFLQENRGTFDLVFIDPPFNQGLVSPVCSQLAASKLLAPEALIYVETDVSEPEPLVPPGWEEYRHKTAGGVTYRLYRVEG